MSRESREVFYVDIGGLSLDEARKAVETWRAALKQAPDLQEDEDEFVPVPEGYERCWWCRKISEEGYGCPHCSDYEDD